MRKRCSIQQGEKKITVDQSKVLKNRLFRFLGGHPVYSVVGESARTIISVFHAFPKVCNKWYLNTLWWRYKSVVILIGFKCSRNVDIDQPLLLHWFLYRCAQLNLYGICHNPIVLVITISLHFVFLSLDIIYFSMLWLLSWIVMRNIYDCEKSMTSSWSNVCAGLVMTF